jgi:C4-dicarboxylate-specific signal transduction histidine kinase
LTKAGICCNTSQPWQKFSGGKNEQVQQLDKFEYIDHMDEVIRLQQSLTSTHVIDEFTSVHSIIQEALAMKEDALSQDNIEVIYNTSEIPQAYLDRHRILQILINLISNSRNALKDSQQENKILQINLKMSKKYICIEVRDNGPGIPPDNMQKIFKYGFSTRKDGHGFGLYYSANSLNMDGRLYAKANEDGVELLSLEFLKVIRYTANQVVGHHNRE